MYPNPIPEEPGCLSFPEPARPGSDALYVHVLWFKGKAYTTTLKRHVAGHQPQLEQLCELFDLFPNMWSPVALCPPLPKFPF